MRRDSGRTITWIVLTLLILLGAQFAAAQGIVTGSISGTVEDAQGAVVTGAKVTARHLDTNRIFNTVTTSSGTFSLRSLPTGNYEVKIESPSFRTYDSTGLTVAVGGDTALGVVRLEVGSTAETVTVEGAPPLIESTSQQIEQVFDSQKTESLPVGNSFDSLSLFVPGVATAGDAAFSNNNGAEFAANGQRARSNNFQIDGQANNDNTIGGPDFFFGNQDALTEVQVITNYDAEYGRNMGTVVNYVTKAGTNNFHGTAYEFWQGDHFDSLTNQSKSPLFSGPQGLPYCAPGQSPSAGTCEQPVVPQYVDNRFGGTIGGPILKDKLWFFGSTNFERTRTGGLPSSTAPGLVPTPEGVQQLVSAFPNSPGVAAYNAFGPQIIKDGNPSYSSLQNILVTNQVNAATGLAFPCTAAGVNGCVPIQFGQLTRFILSPYNDYEGTGRVDVKVTNKDNFFGRYLFQQAATSGVPFGIGNAVGDYYTVGGRNQAIGLDWTRSVSNSLINQARFSYSRALSYFLPGARPDCDLSAPLNCPPQIALTGSAPQDTVAFGMSLNFPQGRIINVYQLQDNVSWQKGKHTIRLGGEYDKQRSPNIGLPNDNGAFSFATFSDLVANNPKSNGTTFAQGNPVFPFKENDLAAYFQDDWRIMDSLTLNLGVRWEWYQQAVNLLHDRDVAQQTGSNPLWSTSLPLSLTTVPHIPEVLHNFAPIVGFAWTPRGRLMGDGKTVIRGGFRIAYDPEFYNLFTNVAQSAPNVKVGTFTAALPSSGFTGLALQSYLGTFNSVANPGLENQLQIAPNLHNPYTEQWNIGIQRSFTSKIVGEVRYVGNHDIDNFQYLNANPALSPLIAAGFGNLISPGLTPCSNLAAPGGPSGYANCNYTHAVQYANTAWSKYNGLQTELRIGGWHNLSATASYTWSHSIDNASEVYGSLNPGASVYGGSTLPWAQNPFSTDKPERANSGLDYPNVFGLALVYQLPIYKAQQGFLGHVLGGWQMNTTYRYTSGQPYTTIQLVPGNGSLCDPTATNNSTFDTCRPILASTSAPLSSVGQCTSATAPGCGMVNLATGAPTSASAVHWILNDPVAAQFFGSPFLGVRRNYLRGQSLTPVNLSFFKDTRIREGLTLEFQATAFNALNSMFRGVPNPILQEAGAGNPSPFESTLYNVSGGGTFAGNPVYDGIAQRRLLFGMKLKF